MSFPEKPLFAVPGWSGINFADMEHPYIDRLGQAHARLVATAAALDDVAVAAPSLFAGWDRAMVLTHLANNADAMRRCVEVAGRGGVAEMYPGGPAQRDADIKSARGAAAALVERRITDSCQQLQNALVEAPQSAWNGRAISRRGEVPLGPGLVVSRLREVEVHHVDLECGYGLPTGTTAGWSRR